MDLYNYLIQYFEIGSLGACSTFPQLLECMLNIMFAIALIVFIFKCLFACVWRIGSGRIV